MDCPASMHGITFSGNSVAAAGPSLSRTKLTLQVGQKKKLTVRGRRIRKCSYRSMDPKIASVGRNGIVKARKKGKTKISVTVTYQSAQKRNKKKLWCRVTVKSDGKGKAGTKPRATGGGKISSVSFVPVIP